MQKLPKNLILLLFLVFLSNSFYAAVSPQQKALLEDLPPDVRASMEQKMETSNKLVEEIEESFEEDNLLITRPEFKDQEPCDNCIFGYNIFLYSPSTFAPVTQIPISSSYVLGPGDEINIEFFGGQNVKKSGYISRNGTFNLPILGPVTLAGLTISEANDYLAKKVSSELSGTEVVFTLKELRSINIYVLGEAYKPGAYTVSSLSSITNILFLSGGVNEQGSLRNIEVKRKGKTIKTFDLYDLLLKGNTSNDTHLEQGDVVFIPFLENKVLLSGSFKRPFLYEFKEGETVEDAIALAGGFNSEVSGKPRLELSFIDSNTNTRNINYFNGLSPDFLQRTLNNSDSINVSEINGLKSETVTLEGEFKHPGVYQILPGDTLVSLVERAGGYSKYAYTPGAIFTRLEVAKQQKASFARSADVLEKTMANAVTTSTKELTGDGYLPILNLIEKLRTIEPAGRQVVDTDLFKLKSDPFLNIELMHGDKLVMPKRSTAVNVVGEVQNSSTLGYNPRYNVNDYIKQAGGFTSAADENRVFIVLPNGESATDSKRFFIRRDAVILPGSTIVVTISPRNLDTIGLATIITPIIGSLALTIASLNTL
jgi:protein involved in polysaccharide export with SLBB domain